MAALNQTQVGVILLTPVGEPGTESDKASAYWENMTGRRGELVFTAKIKDLVDDEVVRANPALTADHIACAATAEILGLPCRRCGQPLPPKPVHSRKDAKALWDDQRLQHRHAGIVCMSCQTEVAAWLTSQQRNPAGVLGLDELLAAQALRESSVYAARMNGFDVVGSLSFDALVALADTVLMPVAVSDWEAVKAVDNGAEYFPARMVWEFAGLSGTPEDRRKDFEALISASSASPSLLSGDLVGSARSRIQDEVINYVNHNLSERRWAYLDDSQVERVRATVAASWGPLNLGMLYNIVWTAFRATADLTSYRTTMGLSSRAGYIVNQISRGAEKVLSGEWERREYDQPAKLPYGPQSLALFRTVLDLDIRTALPDDVEALRRPLPEPDDASVIEHFRRFVISRQSQVGQERAGILDAFLDIYASNAAAMEETLAFDAALNGMLYLEEFVNGGVLDGLRTELAEIRDAARSRSARDR